MAPETKALIELLHKPVGFWERPSKHRAGTLALIGQSGDPAAIPDIVSLLLDHNRDVAQAAALTVSALSKLLNPTELPWLDQLMRERSPYRWSYPSAWADLKPDQLDPLQRLGAASVSALGMASFHFSGYVRQEALCRLNAVTNGTELPFLLLRLNDWVSEVRNTAHRLVRERLTENYAPFFVQNLALVNRLQSTRRSHQQEIVGAIEGLLKDNGSERAIQMGLDSPDKPVKRSCYKLAFESAGLDPRYLVERALSDPDPVTRLLGADKISVLSDVESVSCLLSRVKDDRFAPVRRKALQVFSEQFHEAAHPWLEHALMDSHPSVRGYAQFQLGKNSGFDLRRIYLDTLATSALANLYSAISGLGETGTSPDASVVMPHASHELPRIRRAALRTLARLQADGFVDVSRNNLASRCGRSFFLTSLFIELIDTLNAGFECNGRFNAN